MQIWFPLFYSNYGGPIDGEFADKKAEIQAAIWAVKKLRNLDIFNINIATESIFLLDVINDWFPCYELFGFWGMCVPKEIRRDLTILHRVVMYNSLEEVCWTEIGDETKRLNSQKKQLIDLARKLAENGARQARTENWNN